MCFHRFVSKQNGQQPDLTANSIPTSVPRQGGYGSARLNQCCAPYAKSKFEHFNFNLKLRIEIQNEYMNGTHFILK